ncbi:MAG: hypothetical protein AAFY15_00540 [Cyanobacteria bacterium J06648_11]
MAATTHDCTPIAIPSAWVELGKLSNRCETIHADKSGHFVWVDRPDVIVAAPERVLEQLRED